MDAAMVEGGTCRRSPDALDDALARAHSFERPLVVLDTYERMEALGGHLRRSVLPGLPDAHDRGDRRPRDARRGLARGWLGEPDRASWSSGRSARASRARCSRPRAWTTEPRSAELAEWARRVAAGADPGRQRGAERPGWSPAREGEPPEMVRALDHAAGRGRGRRRPPRRHRRGLDRPRRDRRHAARGAARHRPRRGARVAAARTFSEPLGGGLTLHELVRRAARADLPQPDPERERELRRRIADHLYARAAAGNTLLTVDLAELVDDAAIRAFYGWEGGTRNRIDGCATRDARAAGAAAGRHRPRGVVGADPAADRRGAGARGLRARPGRQRCAGTRRR